MLLDGFEAGAVPCPGCGYGGDGGGEDDGADFGVLRCGIHCGDYVMFGGKSCEEKQCGWVLELADGRGTHSLD